MKRTLILFLLAVVNTFGASHYIRAGAVGTGTGASWANAWTTFAAASFVRGDTYYVAGGAYNEDVYINVNLSGVLWIYFKKANAADNSGDPGWDASYATTVATIRTIDLDKGYVSFDGVTGSAKSGHGIRVYRPSTSGGSVLRLEPDTQPFVIKHLNIEGAGYASSASGIIGIYYSTGPVKGFTVQYCWIHEVTTNGISCASMVGTSFIDYGMLFENNVISETGGCTDPDQHGQGMQFGGIGAVYCIVRNNTLSNILGSAMIAFLIALDNTVYNQIQIYNNVFTQADAATFAGLSPGPIWSEDVKTHTGCSLSNLLIANNAFYNINGASNLAQIVLETATSGNAQKNCVYENCHFSSGTLGLNTNSNNGYYNNNGSVPSGTTNQVNGSSSTFINAAGLNFNVVAGGYAIGAGLDLTATIPTDAAGSIWTLPMGLGPLQVGSNAGGSSIGGKVTLLGSANIN